ncbi:MAG: hypothetical protein II201_01580 [Clostridia bacterium]|nr:hypothetical protein [Clostridia bacterium]
MKKYMSPKLSFKERYTIYSICTASTGDDLIVEEGQYEDYIVESED